MSTISIDYAKDGSGPSMTYRSATKAEDEPCGLYRVTILVPRVGDLSVFDVQTRYVVAASERRAIDAGRCAAGVASYDIPQDVCSRVVASAVRVPLTVAGWGRTQF